MNKGKRPVYRSDLIKMKKDIVKQDKKEDAKMKMPTVKVKKK